MTVLGCSGAGSLAGRLSQLRPSRYIAGLAYAPWTFVVQNQLPHCCLQNAENVILEWLNGVLTGEKPAAGSSYGYLAIAQTKVVDHWKRRTFQATLGRVGARGKAKRGEVAGGWMPSRVFAQEWLTLVGKTRPTAIWAP